MSRIGTLVRNVISNWVVLGANIVFALIITPIVVRALGKESYGIWSVLNGLLSYSDLLYLGLGSAVIKHVALYRAQNSPERVDRLMSVVLTIYTGLGLICLTVFLALSSSVGRLFAEPLLPGAAREAAYTCVLLGIRLMLLFVASAFSGLLSGLDRFDLVNAVRLVSLVIRFSATFALVRAGHQPLLWLASIVTATGLMETIALAIVARMRAERLHVKIVRPAAEELKLLYGFGLQSFFISLAVKLISYTDIAVIGFLLGASSVALYTLPLQLVEYWRMCVAGFTSVVLPRLTGMHTRGDLAGTRSAYINSMRLACFMSGWFGATLITLGPAFLTVWVGPEFGAPLQRVIVLLSIAAFAQMLSSVVPLAFYQALNHLAWPAAVLMLDAVGNLCLSVVLGKRFGLEGVALGTTIPTVFISTILLPPYLCRKLGVPIRRLVIDAVGPGVLLFGVTLMGQVALGRLVGTHASFLVIAFRALATAPIVAGMFFLTFPAEQKLAVRRLIGLAPSRSPEVTAATNI